MELCDPYFWENPKYIVHSLYPAKGQCASHMVNRVTATYLLAFILAFILSTFTNSHTYYIIIGVLATIILLPTFIGLKDLQTKREGFSSQTLLNNQFTLPSVNQTSEPSKDVEGREDTLPFQQTIEEVRNPFHNITVDQYSYAPTRDPAPSIQTPEAKEDLDAMFRVQWTSDPTDVFGKTQSQRMFIVQPNTSIPNDQGSYQNWLYKIPGKTCKEGNGDACYGGTNGATIPWLNM
jgi:hypothetical protein